MTFKDNAKTALAKIVSDLIQNDGIVNQGEIDYMNQVFELLKIGDSNLKKANGLSLSQAITILRHCEKYEKYIVFQILLQLALSDKHLDPSEALFSCAVSASLGIDLPQFDGIQADLISTSNESFDIRDNVIYLEPTNHPDCRSDIRQNYKAISQLLAEHDKCFVYLPTVIEDVMEKKESFRQMLKYIEPTLSEENLTMVEIRMGEMNSTLLSKEVFINYLNANGFQLDYPVFLFKLDTLSSQKDKDYLILKIEDSPLKTLKRFCCFVDSLQTFQFPAELPGKVKRYLSLLTNKHPKTELDDIQYIGFHKIIVDSILRYNCNIGTSRLRISPDLHFYLEDYKGVEVKMTTLCRTLYYFFLQHEEGVMLNELVDYQEELLEYYRLTTTYCDEVKTQQAIENLVDCVGNTINPCLSKIKKSFTSLLGEKANPYLIYGERSEKKHIDLDRSLVIKP